MRRLGLEARTRNQFESRAGSRFEPEDEPGAQKKNRKNKGRSVRKFHKTPLTTPDIIALFVARNEASNFDGESRRELGEFGFRKRLRGDTLQRKKRVHYLRRRQFYAPKFYDRFRAFLMVPRSFWIFSCSRVMA